MKNRLPKICCRKDRNLAFVTLGGRRYYLGTYGSPAAQAEYKRLVASYLAEKTPEPRATAPSVKTARPRQTTVAELAALFLDAKKDYYVKNGRQTKQLERFRVALEFPVRYFLSTPIGDFGPSELRFCRDEMERSGRFCRSYVNTLTNCVRAVVKWGVAEGLTEPSVLVGLQALPPLKKNRAATRESEPVKPVPLETVEKTLPFLTAPVAAMVRLQLLLGCRPGEICEMRARDLDLSGPVWTYRPQSWKTQHLAKGADDAKRIAVGPRAQAILTPYLEEKDADEYLFSPRDAWRDHVRELRRRRKTPLTPSQRAREAKRKESQNSRLNDRYSEDAYGKAVRKAAAKAGVEIWSPNRLRHLAASRVRATYGLEAAQCVLGHARADTTQIYAERDYARAVKIAAEIG